MKPTKEQLESVSEVIHDKLWTPWAKILLDTENISDERRKRWENECFKPYNELSEEMKDLDRKFALLLFDVIE